MVRTSSRRGVALLVSVVLLGALAQPAAAGPLDWLGQGRGALAALWQWWAGWFEAEKHGPMSDPSGLNTAPLPPGDALDEGPMIDPSGLKAKPLPPGDALDEGPNMDPSGQS